MSYDSAVRSEYSITTLASGYVGEENIVNYSPVPRATLERPYVPRAVKISACASMMIAILRTIYLTASWHFENFALGNALTIANVFLHIILGIFILRGYALARALLVSLALLTLGTSLLTLSWLRPAVPDIPGSYLSVVVLSMAALTHLVLLGFLMFPPVLPCTCVRATPTVRHARTVSRRFWSLCTRHIRSMPPELTAACQHF